MRYFTGELDQALPGILEEMFNLEAGKRCFKLRELLYDKNTIKSAQPYPMFEARGVRTTIKHIAGFIVLPRDIFSTFTSTVMPDVIAMSDTYKAKIGSDHLHGYVALESGSKHSTTLKAQSTLEYSVSFAEDDICKRKFIEWNISKLNKVGLARFTWILMSFADLIECVTTKLLRREFGILCETAMIVYDPENQMCASSGLNNITIRDFSIFRNIISISCFGITTPECFPNTTDVEFRKWIQASIKELSVPETVLGWTLMKKSLYFPNIIYSATTQCSVEFIIGQNIERFYKTRGNTFISMNHITYVRRITNDIYVVKQSDVVVDNSGANYPNDVCIDCGVPLYDDVYLLFPNPMSNVCQTVCPVCMHMGLFKPFGQRNRAETTTSDVILARTHWNRTFEDAAYSVKMNEAYRQLLIYLHSGNVVTVSETIELNLVTMVLPNLLENLELQNSGKPVRTFIGYSGSPKSFYQFVELCNSSLLQHFRSYEHMIEYIRSSYLFKIDYIR